jgi:methyltransferase (TIGR00027 family)
VRPGEPSRTAYRVALRRAAHQLLDQPPVFLDPLAIPILVPEDAAALRSNPNHFERGPRARYRRAFVGVRARFTEDQLAHARATGIRQYVILGAGLDTFAYRDPAPASPLRIWEVDHPATQAWKRQRLQEAQISLPAHLTYLPADFEHQDLAAALAGAGFDPRAGAVFAWLGVTPYLTRPVVLATLGYLASATRSGGGVVFDYLLDPGRLPDALRLDHEALAAQARASGEPWQSAFEPVALADELRTLGFRAVQDVSPEALDARYLAHRADGLSVGSMAHLMWAGAALYSA